MLELSPPPGWRTVTLVVVLAVDDLLREEGPACPHCSAQQDVVQVGIAEENLVVHLLLLAGVLVTLTKVCLGSSLQGSETERHGEYVGDSHHFPLWTDWLARAEP